MHLDGVALDFGVESVELLLQLRLGQELPGTRQEGLEERPFPRRQRHMSAIPMDAARGKVDVERSVGQDRVGVAAVAPRDRSDPCRQFRQVEGLHKIVVSARIEAFDPIGDLVERRHAS